MPFTLHYIVHASISTFACLHLTCQTVTIAKYRSNDHAIMLISFTFAIMLLYKFILSVIIRPPQLSLLDFRLLRTRHMSLSTNNADTSHLSCFELLGSAH